MALLLPLTFIIVSYIAAGYAAVTLINADRIDSEAKCPAKRHCHLGVHKHSQRLHWSDIFIWPLVLLFEDRDLALEADLAKKNGGKR